MTRLRCNLNAVTAGLMLLVWGAAMCHAGAGGVGLMSDEQKGATNGRGLDFMAAVRGDIIIDQDEAQKGGNAGYWHRETGLGYDGDMNWTYVNGSVIENWMVYRTRVGAGRYEVFAYIPRAQATTRNARYRIEFYVGDRWTIMREVAVNQYDIYDQWVSLGTYDFPGDPAVFLADDTGESYSGTKRKVGFDAMLFRPIAVPPVTGKFRWPLESYTVTGYTFGQWVGNKRHLGEDARGGAGTAVYAAGAGKVIRAGVQTDYGWVVVIQHDAARVCTVYGHMQARDGKVRIGQTVGKGQLLGYLGTWAENGNWSPHLHFGVRKGLDPGGWQFWGYGTTAEMGNWLKPTDFIRANL